MIKRSVSKLGEALLGKAGSRFRRPYLLKRVWLKVPQILRGNMGRRLQGRIFAAYRKAARLKQDKFPDQLSLPKSFGHRLPERVPELLLARLTYRPGLCVLDIGHANAQRCYLNLFCLG